MTNQSDFLGKTHELLKEAGIPSMISGSIASTYYGRPRATQDIDVVIDPEIENLRSFVKLCREQKYYAEEQAAEDAFRHRSMFNVIDPESGYKLDIIIRKDRSYSEKEFSRRITVALPGIIVEMVSPEDSILSKLEWAKIGRSERQYKDALGVAVTQGTRLDTSYLRYWAKELNLSRELEQLLEEAELAK